MRRHLLKLACVLAAALPAVPASAATWVFETPLSPEVAGTTGTGFARAIFDTTAHTLTITANWSGLTGNTTVAHIHCCVAAPNTGTVGVAVTPGTLPGFPTGVTSGSYSTVLDLTQSTTYTPAFVNNFGGATIPGAEAALLQGMFAERSYFNVHTNFAPGGEIRGFFAVTAAEPQTWALMLLGFGAVGAALRSRPRRKLAYA